MSINFKCGRAQFLSTLHSTGPLLKLATSLMVSTAMVQQADAASFSVTTQIDNGSVGTLSWAIEQANGSSDASNDIIITTNVTLTNDMPLVNFNDAGKTTNIIGNGNTIDGAGNRIFFVDTGEVNMGNLNLTGGGASGGSGGNTNEGNGSGGGGGMGAGGALFINENAVVNATNIDFDQNSANGGRGGDGNDDVNVVGLESNYAGSGGGGGMGGNGGSSNDNTVLQGRGGSGGGGGLYGAGGDGEVFVVPNQFAPPKGNHGGGGGGGGLSGDAGDGLRGGGGGGGLAGDGANGGGYTERFVFFPVVGLIVNGNYGGGGGGGGTDEADDAPVVGSVTNQLGGNFTGEGGDGSGGAQGGSSVGGCPATVVPVGGGDGADGANNQGGGGGGAAGRGQRNPTIPYCPPNNSQGNLIALGPLDGGDGGDGDVFAGGGGGGSGSDSENTAQGPNTVIILGGDGGNGGDGGLGAGGGGGGRGDITGNANSPNAPIATPGSGGDGGNGGRYAGGGGAGANDHASLTHGNGGNGGDFGGGGGTSYGNAGNGGYGGGGGGAVGSDNGNTSGNVTSAGNGGFGGGGGGAGAFDPADIGTTGSPFRANPNSVDVLVGVAGSAGFGAGAGGQADINQTGIISGLPASGGSAGGGGGLGAGGAVFVRQGGQLNITYTQDSTYNTNSVMAGAGGEGTGPGAGNGSDGQARGQAYFLDSNRARVDIADNFTVIYDETIDDAREISRAGGIDKYNCGTMQYGDGSGSVVMPYGGRTDIIEGEFSVLSDARLLYSTTNIGVSGGTNNCADDPILTGTGTLADTNILDGGIHDVGDTTGNTDTMTVVGDYTIQDGGMLHIDAAPGGISDRIVVRDRDFGDADHLGNPLPAGLTQNSASVESAVIIDPGAVLRVMFQVGTYNSGDEWLLIDNEEADLVTSDGSTAILDTDPLGGFSQVNHNLGFGLVTVETNGNFGGISDGNNVILRFDGNLNCDLTFNENSTLGGSVTLNSSGDTSVTFNALPDELKCPTLDTISGEGHVSAAAMLLERSMALTGSIATRVAASWMQDGPAITGVRASQWLATWKRAEEVSNEMDRVDAGKAPLSRASDYEANPHQYPENWGLPKEDPEKTTVWGRMLGDGRWVSGDGNAADSSRYGAGLMVGADRKVSEHMRLGVAMGVGRDWFNVEERRRTDITVDSISGSLYGSYTKGAWQSMLVGSVAHQSWDTKRRIIFPIVSGQPVIDRTATAEYDAIYWAIRGELGYLHVTENNWLIRPSATARWAQLHTGSFHEEGAGDVNLISDGAVFRSIQTSIGIRASKEKQLDNGWMRTFQFKGEWLHQWSDNYQEAAFAFEGDGTNPQVDFDIRSAEESPASALLGVGVSFTNDSGLTGYLTGDAILSPTTFHPSVAAGIKLRF